jgi:hypothetical protein
MALVALAANYDKKMSEALLELWLELLAPYDAETVRRAVRRVMETYAYKTLPPFAVIRQALDDLAGLSERALERQATAEWGRLLRAIADRGHRAQPRLHPTTDYVLRLLGGWQAACMWLETELAFKRRDFVAFWTDAHGRVDLMNEGAAALAAHPAFARPALDSGRKAPPRAARGPLPMGEALRELLP